MASTFWDAKYGGEEFIYGKQPNEFLMSQVAKLKPNGAILCLAEGEGRNAVYLATVGFKVTAVDCSVVGLKKLQRLADASGVHIDTVVADLTEFDIGTSKWDGIVSIWCHIPPLLRRSVHADCVRGLKSGGVFILEAYTAKQLEFGTGGPASKNLMMNRTDLQHELAGLSELTINELQREVYEGIGHNGISAVVQCVGIK